MAELEFLRRLAETNSALTPGVALAVGDDGCVLAGGGDLTASVDTVVEGRHFTAGTDPEQVGYKAMAAALSDLAAMGAVPVAALIALSGPTGVWSAVQGGLQSCGEAFACPIVGGDTTAADVLTVSVTVIGRLAVAQGRFLQRSTARSGDLLIVTGPLGGAYNPETGGGRHLRPNPRLDIGQWLAQRDFVHAAMDISDGLLVDATRMAEASGLGLLLFGTKVPLHPDIDTWTDGVRAAMTDGEDYELLFSISPEHWPNLVVAWPFGDHALVTQVGMLRSEAGAVLIEDGMGRIGSPPESWQVFQHGA